MVLHWFIYSYCVNYVNYVNYVVYINDSSCPLAV